MIHLENDYLIVTAEEQGAELTSIILKKDHTEYLWNANPAYWSRHAPILFPIVGRLNNDTCYVEGAKYKMTQHGFARDMTFEVLDVTKDSVAFNLQSNEQTLGKYPYHFSLVIRYTLMNQSITVSYEVHNKNDAEMPFSIGAHPAFNVPLLPNETLEDYYLSFKDVEKMETYLLENGQLHNCKITIGEPTNQLPLTIGLFKNDALIFEEMNTNEISIRSTKNDKFITVSFPNFPYVGVWSPPSGAPFVCIEPWYGIADITGEPTELKHKKGMNYISVNEIFKSAYHITVG